MFTLEEILKAWKACYGEDMREEYAGFVEELEAIAVLNFIAQELKDPERVIPILLEFLNEEDINAIMQKLKEQNL